MSRRRIGLVTCMELPEPDPEAAPLIDAVRAKGVDAAWIAWDDPAVDWRAFDVCIVRSTWNYHRMPDLFLQWIDRASQQVPIWNPPAALIWNAHKRYLAELSRMGLPVVPTVLLSRGADASLAEAAREQGWKTIVVKPAVSAASRETILVNEQTWSEGEQHLARLLAAEDVLVQEYQVSVEGTGERSLVFIDGELTHAVRKSSRFGGQHEAVRGPMPIAEDEVRVARRILEAAQERSGVSRLLYARVDLTRNEEGAPILMELELIEPSLFTHLSEPALRRLAEKIAAA